MSQMAPEAPPAAPAGGGAPKRENVFTRKIGPLPMWGWVAIVATVLIGYAYYQSRKSSSSTADTTATGTDASQVPQFVNQTYTSVTPPSAPTPPPTSTGTPTPGPTTGTQIPGHHVVTATGHESLAQIAKKYGTTPGDILKFTEQHKTHISPAEAKFFKSGGKGKIPRGLVLWVPEPQVKVK